MPSEAHQRFQASKTIGYDQWHDGEPYDLDAFAEMTQAERDAEAADVRSMPRPTWRDLQILGRHGSNESIERLRHLLAEGSADGRAHALRELIDAGKIPPAVCDAQLSHVLEVVTENDSMTCALLIATEHAGPRSKLALLRATMARPGVAIHFAGALCDMHKLSDDMAAFDPKLRPTLLKLLPDEPPAERAKAFATFCKWLGIDDPQSIPTPDSGGSLAWAEKMWLRG